MKKRVLSLLMTVIMLLGISCAVPVMAVSVPGEVAEDFTAGVVTGDLATTYPDGKNVDISAIEVPCSVSGNIVTLSANATVPASNDWGVSGFHINNKFIQSLSQNNWGPEFAKDTKILFSAKVRKAADATKDAKLNVAFSSWYANQYEGGKALFADAYPTETDGFLVDSTEWTDFSAIITAPKNCGGNTWNMTLGLSKGTQAGAKVEVDMSSIYFGAEYAHDIKVTTSGATNIEAGSNAVINADADILNQVGAKYSTQGTFNWYALNEARTQIVSEITITPGSDGKATIAINSSVPAGDYVIAVQSVENAEMVKSFPITVGTKDWSDHIPEDIDNIITTYPTEGGNLDINDGNVSAIASGNVATLSANADSDGNADHALQGFIINEKFISDLSTDKTEVAVSQGAKIKFTVKVRKAAGATSDGRINVAYSIPGSGNNGAWHYPDNYPEGFVVDSAEWMDFEATITARENIGGASYWQVLFGFYDGMTAGAKVEIDMESFRFVPYMAYDIKITDNSGQAILDPGVATSFTADIVDSDGNAMGGEEVFSWALLNEEKTAVVSGVTFTPDDIDATTVDVVVGNTVTPGNYYLAAESKSGETTGWIKSIPVTVLKPTINDYVAGTVPGEIDDIIITRTDDGDQTMGLTDTAEFAASVVDSNDELVSGEQNFVWFVMNEIRKDDVTADFTVTPSADTTTATVTPKLSTANGTYYVMAQYADDERIVKAIKIKIDKAQSVVNSANLINDGSSSEIAAQLADIAVIVEVSDETKAILTESAVKSEAAKILADSFDNENKLSTSDMNAVKSAIEKAIVIALYNENPASVTLFDAEGKFVYADELHLAEIDTAGVTLYDVFNTTLSAEGRNAIQTLLKSTQITTINGFEKTLKENIVLYGIKYPDEIGVSYLEDILTTKNLAATGIDAPKYLARADKGATHQAIARELYTVEELIAALEKEPTTGNGGDSGGGGGGGGAYTAPIESAPAENEPGETNVQPAYPKFADVKEEHWAYTDIYYLRERNIINGIDENTFNPNGNITREQFAKILCAALNIETTSANADFTDVDNNAWYAPFIAAVYNKGIVNGVDEKNFGVGANITRQDLCTMIYRALDSEKYSYTALGFTDDANISEYARDAVATLKGLEIVNGYNDGSFNPQGLCTRAEAAKIICKLLAITEVLK